MASAVPMNHPFCFVSVGMDMRHVSEVSIEEAIVQGSGCNYIRLSCSEGKSLPLKYLYFIS